MWNCRSTISRCGVPHYIWMWQCVPGRAHPYLDVRSRTRGYGRARLDMRRLISIWDPLPGYGIPYLDMRSHIWMWEPKSGYGIPYPDMESDIQMWLLVSRSCHPYRDWQIRFQCGRHALPGGGGHDSTRKHRKTVVFWSRVAAEGIAGKHSEIGSHLQAHFIRFPATSF